MKKILFSALTAFSIAASAQAPAYVPTVGLAGWWPLDNSPSDVQNGLGGALYGSPLPTATSNRFGTSNSAYCFNGSNYITVPDHPSLSGFADMSISVWVNKSSSSVLSALVTKWQQKAVCNSMGDTYGLWMSGNSPDYTNNNNVYAGFSTLYTLTSPQLNTWTHIVVTSHHATGQKIYVNAVCVATRSTGCLGNICSTTGPLSFAVEDCWHCTGLKQRYFTGCLDDIGIWSRELDTCEIRTLYLSQNAAISPIVSNSTICVQPSGNMTVSVSSSFTASPVTYNWSGPDIIGTSSGTLVTVGPTPGIYTVTATASLGCTGTATFAVINKCCTQPTTGLTPLTSLGTTFSGNSYFISSNITLSGSTTFQNAEVLFLPGVKITVPAGRTLYLEDVHLYSCGSSRWQGIEVQDGGSVETTLGNTHSLIEDAEIGIELDGITASHANPPLYLNNVAFNKNYIGVKISNSSSAVTSLPIEITECVFSSRDLNFTSYPSALSWPSTDATSGLRSAFLSTGGLQAPYDLGGASQANLKFPYTGTIGPAQPGHIGIKIENVGNVTGTLPASGVEFGNSVTGGRNSFNLFDGLGEGIDITDASLTTMNNVFQNMKRYIVGGSTFFGGTAINQQIKSLMNAKLDLRPVGGSYQSTTYGNRFWECFNGVAATNVYDVNIEYGIFRSTHVASAGNVFSPGYGGVSLESNRFNYNVRYSEFNNISYNLSVNLINGNYDIGAGNVAGIYAAGISFKENYFGPEVNSSNGISSQFCNSAIYIDGSSASGSWASPGVCEIISNKIDRSYRGIYTNETRDFPVEIGGNNILIRDDNFIQAGAAQYGIYARKSADMMKIRDNTVAGQGISNKAVKLIHCIDNLSTSGTGTYPEVVKNNVSNAFKGFVFEGNQRNTKWQCNNLTVPMTHGLSLLNQGIIGQQGSSSWESGNLFLGTWVSNVNYYTATDASSSPGSSPLYVALLGGPAPTHFTSGGTPYVNGSTFISSFLPGSGNECIFSFGYPKTPAQRQAGGTPTGLSDLKTGTDITLGIYPNPSSGNVVVSSVENLSKIRVMDLAGKVVYASDVSGNSVTLDLTSLSNAVYLIEVTTRNNQVVHGKFIKSGNQ